MSLWGALRTQVLCQKFLILLILSKNLDLIQLLRAHQIAALQIAELFILHLFEDPYHIEFFE